MKADGSEYILYTYETIDELGNKENIDSLTEYEKGDRVEVFFDERYNKVKMRPYQKTRPKCDKCGKPYKEEDAPKHEYCNIKRM
jgi:hypothetical protein